MADLYADMFELAPVSLWLEDYSELQALFVQWRDQGITDLRAHLHAHPSLLDDCKRRLKVLRVNRRTLVQYGARDLQHLVDNLHLVMRDDVQTAFIEELGQLWDGRQHLSTRTINHTLQGERMHLQLSASVMPGHEARWDRVLVSLENVTERERALAHARALFEHSPISLWLVDFSAVRALLAQALPRGQAVPSLEGDAGFIDRCLAAMVLRDVNRRTLDLLGARDLETLRRGLPQVLTPRLRSLMGEQLAELWRGGPIRGHEAPLRTLDGREVFVVLQVSALPGHHEQWDQVLLSLTDISDRKRAEDALAFVSSHDALTGLYNRSHFNAQLARLDAAATAVTLVAIDLDGLKATNDSLGHAAGDALLQRAARLIGAFVDAPGFAARIGGDEFVLLLPGLDEPQAEAIVQRLLAVVDADNRMAGDAPPLRVSVGIAERAAGEGLEATARRADARMYEHKRRRYAERGIDRRLP
ncbi:GGDEF domain-containing protein [Aquabacterium humicola]|uniref:GGDEF domain-containing protein n=1 Tax=Aquabacterium humicola TaxID=3237377 RepID=UPI00254330C1|nr:sensor domain-containing diguanylate cyclase [Rubrivivax pictus]